MNKAEECIVQYFHKLLFSTDVNKIKLAYQFAENYGLLSFELYKISPFYSGFDQLTLDVPESAIRIRSNVPVNLVRRWNTSLVFYKDKRVYIGELLWETFKKRNTIRNDNHTIIFYDHLSVKYILDIHFRRDNYEFRIKKRK